MSIEAEIVDVRFTDTEAVLILKGNNRGQDGLTVVNPNPHLRALIGEKIWGGDTYIMIGQTKIADRISYTRIRLVEKPVKAPPVST